MIDLKTSSIILAAVIVSSLNTTVIHAQETQDSNAVAEISIDGGSIDVSGIGDEFSDIVEEENISQDTGAAPQFNLNSFPSVLFTFWEQASIEEAKNSRGLTKAPEEIPEVKAVEEPISFEEEEVPIDPGIRTIKLGGIAYQTKSDWTIWLNGERVTPSALPEQVLDLRVHKNYIELKWFDEFKNQIIPIRIRPHQRFNIDSRIFLPG